MPTSRLRRLVACLLITWLPAATVRAENLVFQIGLPTTQTRVFDINNPITYNFGVTLAGGAANLQGVQFAFFVDRGQNTTAPVVFNLYNGLGGVSGTNVTTGTNVSLGITTVSATSYPTAGGNNIFASLSAPIFLTAGEYSVQLSTTATGAGRTYSWRPGPLQLTSTSGGNLSNFLYVEDNNQIGSAGNTLNAANPVLAQPLLSATSVNFGNFRSGATLSQVLTLTNDNLPTANNYSQALASGTTTTSGGASVSGVPTTASPLGQGFIQNLNVGLASGSAGPANGQVGLSYLSVPGTSATTGTTAIGSGAIAVTGTGFDWANAKVSSGTFAFGNVRTGSAATSQTVAIGNQTVVSSTYQDLLNVSGSTTNAKVTATGFSNLAASASGTATNSVSLAASTTTAGSLASTVSLAYTSNANGVVGLTNGTATFVGGAGPSIATTGGVYDYANAVYTGTAFAFGYIHRGGPSASGTAAIGNQTVTSGSYQDTLNVSAATGNPLVGASGFTGLAPSASGATTNNLVVSVGSGTAGSLASTLALSLVSNANGVAGLSNGTATTVGSPSSITTTGTVFTGLSTWNVNGGGQWGTLASSFGSNWNWATFDGSPGVDSSFTNTDTATFGGALTSGSATVTVTAATPSVKSVTFNNAAATYSVAGVSGGSLALLNTGTVAATVAVIAGSHAMSLPVALGSNTDFDVAGGSILSMSGVLSGAKAIATIGTGTTIFSGNNTYGGITSVAAGTLLINGSQASATGAITVAGGATLGGRGTAGGAVNVLANGILSPGSSIESLAVGATTFSSGSSTFFYEVDSAAALSAAADLLVSNGNLAIGSGSILAFTDLANTPVAFPQGTKFTLISYGSNSWDSGLFTYQGNELANLEMFSAGLNQWEIRYDDPVGGSNFTSDQLSGDSVTITAVPEPASLTLAGIGIAAAALVLVRSRRR